MQKSNERLIIRIVAGVVALAALAALCLAQWVPQPAPSTARLRGVSVVDERVAWASGASGTCLRTTDSGKSWQSIKVPEASELDFRDVEAFDASTAYLLSIGEGERSRIYKTTDGGTSWRLQFTNHNPKAFYDAMAFWDSRNGIAVSDPVDGRFVILRTADGGGTWKEAPPETIPPAIEGEAAFAASGTCLTVQGQNNVWLASGGAAARVFRSSDRGRTWRVAVTPITAGNPSSGIFSIAFSSERDGIVVGGDYRKEDEARNNIAFTTDGGATWKLVSASRLGGFRSGVCYLPGFAGKRVIAVGPSGSDYSVDGGANWVGLGSSGYHAVGVGNSRGAIWAVGENGLIAKYAVTR